MLTTGFGNLAGQALGNLDCLGDAAPFRYQSRNVRARSEIAPFFEHLNSGTHKRSCASDFPCIRGDEMIKVKMR